TCVLPIWDRHVDLDDPSGRGREVRLLAAVPVRSPQGDRGGAPPAARQQPAEPEGQGLPGQGGPVRDARALAARGGRGAAGARAGRRGGALALLRAARRGGAARSRTPRARRGRFRGGAAMSADLRTRYLGIELRNPVVPSASTLSSRIDNLKRLQEAGASAVVMQSLFEEQTELEDYNTGPDAYLRHLEQTKAELEIPVIGSLNGASEGGWIRYARLIQDAGADALELNVYVVASDPDVTSAEVESRYLELVSAVRESVSIPLAVKVGPFFSSMANVARRLVEAGADGLVLFNRFYQPDIDLETLEVDPTLHLSSSEECLLPLRWIAILRGRVRASLAATTGVHRWEDAMKLILAGADVTMMASALFRNGPEHVASVLAGIELWLDEHEYASVEQAKGSVSQANVADPMAYARANYMQMIVSYTSPYDWRLGTSEPRA